eukprot:g10718.t1
MNTMLFTIEFENFVPKGFFDRLNVVMLECELEMKLKKSGKKRSILEDAKVQDRQLNDLIYIYNDNIGKKQGDNMVDQVKVFKNWSIIDFGLGQTFGVLKGQQCIHIVSIAGTGSNALEVIQLKITRMIVRLNIDFYNGKLDGNSITIGGKGAIDDIVCIENGSVNLYELHDPEKYPNEGEEQLKLEQSVTRIEDSQKIIFNKLDNMTNLLLTLHSKEFPRWVLLIPDEYPEEGSGWFDKMNNLFSKKKKDILQKLGMINCWRLIVLDEGPMLEKFKGTPASQFVHKGIKIETAGENLKKIVPALKCFSTLIKIGTTVTGFPINLQEMFKSLTNIDTGNLCDFYSRLEIDNEDKLDINEDENGYKKTK